MVASLGARPLVSPACQLLLLLACPCLQLLGTEAPQPFGAHGPKILSSPLLQPLNNPAGDPGVLQLLFPGQTLLLRGGQSHKRMRAEGLVTQGNQTSMATKGLIAQRATGAREPGEPEQSGRLAKEIKAKRLWELGAAAKRVKKLRTQRVQGLKRKDSQLEPGDGASGSDGTNSQKGAPGTGENGSSAESSAAGGLGAWGKGERLMGHDALLLSDSSDIGSELEAGSSRAEEVRRQGHEELKSGEEEALRALAAASQDSLKDPRTLIRMTVEQDLMRRKDSELEALVTAQTADSLIEASSPHVIETIWNPSVVLPGGKEGSLQNFRDECVGFDEEGNRLAPNIYRWRGRLVRVLTASRYEEEAAEISASGEDAGNNEVKEIEDIRILGLEDLETKERIYSYKPSPQISLKGHKGLTLEDFWAERVATSEWSVYKLRDRTLNVTFYDRENKNVSIKQIIDSEDGSIVYDHNPYGLTTKELSSSGHNNPEARVDPDMLSNRYLLDPPSNYLQLARIKDEFLSTGPPFGEIKIAWPEPAQDGVLDFTGTVIWICGLGGKASVGPKIADRIYLPWIKWIFLEAPVQPVPIQGNSLNNSWYEVTEIADNHTRENFQELRRSADFVSKIVQEEIRRGQHPHHVVLVGVGQGGGVAIDAAMRLYQYEEVDEETGAKQTMHGKLGGLACLSSWTPKSLSRLEPAWAQQLERTWWRGKEVGWRGGVSTYAGHGTKDRTVPLALGKKGFKRLEKLGFDTDTLDKYDMGHGMCRTQIDDLRLFISHRIPRGRLTLQEFLGPHSFPTTVWNEKAGYHKRESIVPKGPGVKFPIF